MCLVLTVMVAFEPVQDEWKADRAFLWLDLTIGVVSFVLVFWRRRFPLGVAVVLTVFGAFSATASGPGVLAAVSLASRRVWWQIVLVGGLNLVAGQVYRVLVPGQSSTDSWWLGPDSMKVDSKGDIYVAQWFGGRILKLSPEGKLLHVFRIAAGVSPLPVLARRLSSHETRSPPGTYS